MSKEKVNIENTIKVINNNLELFYQQKIQEALVEFEKVLGNVMSTVDMLFQYRETNSEFVLDEEKLKNSLVEAMYALEERDMILLADILQYDFIEYLQELLVVME